MSCTLNLRINTRYYGNRTCNTLLYTLILITQFTRYIFCQSVIEFSIQQLISRDYNSGDYLNRCQGGTLISFLVVLKYEWMDRLE